MKPLIINGGADDVLFVDRGFGIDGELELYIEYDGDFESLSTIYLSRPQVIKLRDHLNEILDD